MPGPFYFAWVGGPVVPAFEVLVAGDTWGGSIQIQGDVWGGRLSTTVEVVGGSAFVNSGSLRNGRSYTMQRSGFPDSSVNVAGGFLVGVTTSGAAIFVNEDEASIVILNNLNGLIAGETYGISGPGIAVATTFVCPSGVNGFGEAAITLSQPATSSSGFAFLTITRAADRDVVKNLSGDLSGLVESQPYDVFGQGIPNGTVAFWDGDTSLNLSAEATATRFGSTMLLSIPETCPDGGAFDPEVHNVEDELVFSYEITEAEGDFATAKMVIKNPGIGLLAPAQSRWAWISFDDGGTIRPLFHGRLVGVPDDLAGETVTLTLRARPDDFLAQKATLADTLRTMPYWDPVFLAANEADPDTVLETRTAAWHVDRLTHAVTVTDIVAGEDGTLVVGEGDHGYDDFSITYGSPPAARCNVTASVTYSQEGEGDIDLTERLWEAFKKKSETTESIVATGIQLAYPIVPTFTGDGFKSSWPAASTDIGGGWSIGSAASLREATWMATKPYGVRYLRPAPAAQPVQPSFQTETGALTGATTFEAPMMPNELSSVGGGTQMYDVLFDTSLFAINLPVHYRGVRTRNETLSFSLEADIQSALIGEAETIDLSSNFVDQPVDPGGALPIGDLRRNSYFVTDRGTLSVEFLLLLARDRLLTRSRCVVLKCLLTDWRQAIDLNCRWNIEVHDRRLPGGVATGKVTSMTLNLGGDGAFSAEITLGCTIGTGIAAEATGGTGVYADDGLFDPGVQQVVGGDTELLAGELVYRSIDNIAVIDDDGVDFYNPQNQVYEPAVLGGLLEQKAAIDAVSTVIVKSPEGDGGISTVGQTYISTIPAYGFPSNIYPVTPVEALQQEPTLVELRFTPVDGGSFQSDFFVITQKLAVPKTIDLAAA